MAGALRFSLGAAAVDAGLVPAGGVPTPGRGSPGCTGLAGAAGVAEATARLTWPAAAGGTAPTPGRGTRGIDPSAGSLPGGGCRTADEGGVMPPARGLGSPPEFGGLRDAGTTGLVGAEPAPDAGGVPVGAELAGSSGPTKSVGSGSFSAAASARTAADTAGLEREGADAELAVPPGCAGLPEGAVGEAGPGGIARVPGEGDRPAGEPGVGVFDPAGPPP